MLLASATAALLFSVFATAPAKATLNDAQLCEAHHSALAWNAALVSCTAAIEAKTIDGPAMGLLHSNRADALMKKDKIKDAVADYTTAIELNPKAAAPLFSRGGAYLQLKKADPAIADFEAVVRLHPDNVFAHFGLGSAYYLKKNWPKAIASLSRAIALRADYGIAYRLRADVYAAQGEKAKSDADLAKAKKLGVRMAAKPAPELAPASAPKTEGPIYSAQAPVEKRVLEYLTDCAAANQIGKWDDAVAACSLAIQSKQLTGARLAGAYSDRAIAHDESHRTDEAQADYSKALVIDPGNALILANRATSFAKQGEMERAMADFAAAIKAQPKFAFAYAMRGLTYDALGEKDKANADMLKAYKLGERNPILVEKLTSANLIKE
jgi:tetratricopeptide (TPR) repeat protein